MTFRRLVLLALVPLAAVPGLAQEPARQIHITVYGEESCPTPRDEEEIVVCARRPEEERYRLPPTLRERPDRPAEISWHARNEVLEEDARTMRPDSCSVVGSGGQGGCASALVRQWYDERRGRRTR